LTDQQKEFVTTIENNVERMKILVEDLSDISRIESGQLKISIEPIDLSKVLAQAKDGVMSQIEARNHSLVEEIEPKLPHVQADASRLVQVLVNLLSNAYKYTPDGGTITLSAKHDDNHIKISIKDSGIGMTPEQVAQLGTKFFRADNEHVTQQPGTGLGFAITRNLIELMKGQLDIHSEVGTGSTFAFTLPVSSTKAKPVKLTETATEK
jgi:signal transduction histidine kinase